MDVALITGGLVLLLAGMLAWSQGRRADDTPPLLAVDNRCPACGHPVHEHYLGRRLSSVFRGCDVDGCDCDVPITRVQAP